MVPRNYQMWSFKPQVARTIWRPQDILSSAIWDSEWKEDLTAVPLFITQAYLTRIWIYTDSRETNVRCTENRGYEVTLTIRVSLLVLELHTSLLLRYLLYLLYLRYLLYDPITHSVTFPSVRYPLPRAQCRLVTWLEFENQNPRVDFGSPSTFPTTPFLTNLSGSNPPAN